jgi:hypothetical protein
MGEVLGVSLSAALTQMLLVRELRMRIVGDGVDEVRRLNILLLRIHFTGTDILTLVYPTQIIAKILTSTAYIHMLPTELQEKATASWMRALHVVFQCQMVCHLLVPEVLPIHCSRCRPFSRHSSCCILVCLYY